MVHLEDMANIGPTLAAWLHEAGIETPEQLRTVGAVEAYVRCVGEFHEEVGWPALYMIEGAIERVHWHEISDKRCAQLRTAAEAKLAQANAA